MISNRWEYRLKKARATIVLTIDSDKAEEFRDFAEKELPRFGTGYIAIDRKLLSGEDGTIYEEI